MQKTFWISLIILLIAGSSWALNEQLPGLEEDNTAMTNEELRSLSIANQIKSDGKLDMYDKPIDNVEDPTDAQDAMTLNYADTNYQVLDADLTAIAALADTDSNIIVGNGDTWVAETGATARASLGLVIGTDVQAYDAQLADLADGSLSGAGTCDTSALTGTTYLPDDTVDNTALKTATGEVSGDGANYVLPGGAYAFYPQTKATGTTPSLIVQISEAGSVTTDTYVQRIYMSTDGTLAYAQCTYITASGLDYWIFLLVDKTTNEIKAAWQSPDHPSYGNGGDADKMPHPFLDYNKENEKIILLDKDTCKIVKTKSKQIGKSILTLINEDYDIGENEYKYKPLHSGKFLGEKPVMIKSIPDYIKVRKLRRKQ